MANFKLKGILYNDVIQLEHYEGYMKCER